MLHSWLLFRLQDLNTHRIVPNGFLIVQNHGSCSQHDRGQSTAELPRTINFFGAVWPESVTKIIMVAEAESMSWCKHHDQNHHGEAGFDPELLLVMAKGGDGAALGRLLERYRNYMGLLVRLQVGRRLRTKVDIEDLFRKSGWRFTARSRYSVGAPSESFSPGYAG